MSLLQEASAIFYHPLDSDKTEFLVSQVWDGDPAFTEGIISESASAISSAGMSIGSPFTFLTSVGSENPTATTVDRLTDTTALLGFAGEPGDGSNLRVATISGSDISFGTSVEFSATDLTQRLYGVAVLTPEKFIIFYDEGVAGKARVGTISGTTITLFPETTFDDLGGDRLRATTLKAGVSGCAAAAYSPIGGSSGIAIIAAISGVSGTELVFGNKSPYQTGSRTAENFITAPNGGIGPFSVAVAHQRDDDLDLVLKVGTISGLDITFGSGLFIDASDTLAAYEAKMTSLQDNIFVLGWLNGSNTDTPRSVNCTAFSISGTSLSSGTNIVVEAGRPINTTEEMTLVRTNNTTFQFFYNRAGFFGNTTSPGRVHTVTLTDVDNLTLDFGNSASLPGVRMIGVWADALTAETYLYGYRDFDADDDLKLLTGTLDLDNGLTASAGGAYASAVSGEHVTICMWAQEPTNSDSSIVVERGYIISLSEASGITFGGSTLEWAASGLSGLFLTMNDGDPHFLVLDFDHLGGDIWELNTSIDGSPFSSEGTRGTLAPISSDTVPEIALSNPSGIDQWVDELAMWVENTKFSDFDLLKLYSLGAEFDLPLSEFSEFSFPVSGILTLQIKGHDTTSGTITLQHLGHDTVDDTFILQQTGHESVSGTLTLQHLGHDTINDNITLQQFGHDTIDEIITLKQIGHDTISGTLTLQQAGHETSDETITLHIHGPAGGDTDLHSVGKDTTGILDELDIIFYHALDDKTEFTQGQTWTGDPEFVGGKIGSGNSAIAPTSVSYEVDGDIDDPNPAGDSFQPRELLKLTDTKIVDIHGSFEGGVWNRRATIGTIDIDTSTVTWGTSFIARVGNTNANGTALTSGTFLQIDGSSAFAGESRVGTVSGSDISYGTTDVWSAAGLTDFDIKTLSASSVLLAYGDGTLDTGRVIIGTIAGTNTTYTSPTSFSSSGFINSVNIASMSTSGFVVCFREDEDDSFRAIVGTISGTSVSFSGLPILVDSDIGTSFGNTISAVRLDATKFLVCYHGTSNALRTKIGTISGSSISFEASQIPPGATGVPPTQRGITVDQMSSDTFTVNYQTFVPSARSLGTNVGKFVDGVLTWAQASQFTLTAVEASIATLPIQSDVFVLSLRKQSGGNGSQFSIATINESSDLTASVPIRYPTAIGEDRIITCFWARNPTTSGGEIVLQRGYTATFTSGSIALGTETATWTGSSIETVMSTLNDGGEHFLVADFSHISGTTWALQTSVDGDPFVNHGNEIGQAIISSTSNPEIVITNPAEADQYLDEAVMWAGNADAFNDTELSRLNALADVFDLTMPNFAQSFLETSGNITLQQTGHDVISDEINLFINGVATISGDISLFIPGPVQIQDDITIFLCCPFDTASGTQTLHISGGVDNVFDRIIDNFVKVTDFDPQLIGRFDNTNPTTVTIEVWDLIDGTNNIVPLLSSGVDQIGDTITWRWSTEFLPKDNNLGQFAFRMTADTGETVDGEFMLDNPEGHRWIHPDDSDDFRVEI